MMKNKYLLSGIPALMLAFVSVFSACENGTTEVEGTVGISSQQAPNVTATVVKGGVLLEWNPIVNASYTVWRKAPDAEVFSLTLSGDNYYQDKTTGKVRFLDLVSDSNELKKDVEYTYTVTAYGTEQTIGKTEVKAKIAEIPAKGTQVAPVTGVSLTLLPDDETITVSWTLPEGVPAQTYSVSVYRDGQYQVDSDWASFGKTSASLDWDSNNQSDGEYVAFVTAVGNSYFKNSDFTASAGKQHENLFNSDYPSAWLSSPIINADRTIKNFVAYISFGVKSGASYTVERAPVAPDGNAGAYAAVSLYRSTSDTTALTPGELATYIANNGSVYDKSLPPTAGNYKYRVKATKGTATHTMESSSISVDPRDYIISSINIGAKKVDGSNYTYAVSPSFYRGTLQTGDKLVISYLTSYSPPSYSSYFNDGIEFSKAELDAATSKNLVLPENTSGYNAYVQAYIVFADGRASQNVSYNYWNGNGVSYGGEYQDYNNGNWVYYAELDY